MKNNSSEHIVTEMIASLKTLAKEQEDSGFKKFTRSEIELAELALLSILKPIEEHQYKKSGESAVEYADWLGALGLASIITLLSEEKVKPLAPFREYFLYAVALALRASGNASAAFDQFLAARRASIAHKNYSLAARASIDIGINYYQEKRNVAKAKNWYMKAIKEADAVKDNLTKAKALNNLGAIYIDEDSDRAMGLLKESIALKEEAKASKDEIMPTLFNLGVLQAQAGERKQAYEIFKKSAEYTESVGDIYNLIRSLLNLGNEAAALGKFAEASASYSRGIELANANDDTVALQMLHQAFAVAASRFEKYSLASYEFKALHQVLWQLGNEEQAAIALHDLALCLVETRKKSEARQYINQALEIFKAKRNIDWQRRCLLLISVEIADTLSDEQMKFLKKAVDLRGGQDKILKLQAIREYWEKLLELGNNKEAHRQLNREISWLKKDPERLSERLHHAGMVLLGKELYAEAIQCLNKALDITLTDDQIAKAEIRQDLATAYAEFGDYDHSSILFQSNVELANQLNNRVLKANNIGNLGEVERRAGLIDNSINHLTEAIQLTRSYKDEKATSYWLNNFALLLIEKKEFKKANVALKEGLKKAKEVSALSEEARILGTIGILSAERNQFEKAINNYTQAINIANKSEENTFSLEMQFNRAASFRALNKRNEALSDMYKIVKETYNNRAFKLCNKTSSYAAIWSIQWKRPAKGGEFSAFSLFSGAKIESYDGADFVFLILFAYQNFTEKQYEHYFKVLKNEIKQREEWYYLLQKVEEIQTEMKKVQIGDWDSFSKLIRSNASHSKAGNT